MKQASDSNRMLVTRHLPGEAGIWVFIFGDVLVFSLLFILFTRDRGLEVELYRTSKAHLNQTYAVINTILLLSSSWFVATAVEAARREKGRITSACLIVAIVCGMGFVVIKLFEYHDKFNDGVTINTNGFYTYYFMLTGIHFVHALIGIGVLSFLTRYTWDGVLDSKRLSFLESGASYWHMVDLLWMGLFALLYLLR